MNHPRQILSACRLLITLVAVVSGLHAQTFDLNAAREPIVSLDGLWRFHPGDDMRWSAKDFDDSEWTQLRSDRSWTKQGFPGLGGFAWYRFKLQVPDGGKHVGLLMAPISTGYQVYANGNLIDAVGSSMPTSNPIFPVRPRTVTLLPPNGAGPQTIEIALRVWNYEPFAIWLGGGSIGSGSVAGEPALLEKRLRGLRSTRVLGFTNEYASALLAFLVGLTVFALFLFRSEDREYLWFSILLLATATSIVLHLILNLSLLPFPLCRLLEDTAISLSVYAALAFFSIVLQVKRSFAWRIACVTIIASSLTTALYYFRLTEIGTAYAALLALELPAYLWIMVTLGFRAWQKDLSALILLIPATFYYGSELLELVGFVNHQFDQPFRVPDFNALIVAQPFPLYVNDVFTYLFVLALLVYLVRRFSLARKEEARLSTELNAARTIQSLLMQGSNQQAPGFSVQTAYLPATEVGGDFFRVDHSKDGSVSIVVGDVSGKGLKAAMMVSIILGALRGYKVRSPGKILEHLNEVLYGQIDGFATCCAVLISSDGRLTIANAGHLAPYLDGSELGTPGSLPLGITSDITYDEAEYSIACGQQIMLLSDGVVEAINDKGDLLGFERTLQMSKGTASSVAEAAKQFGQEDDITVVTVTAK